ncbi:MAG: serine/threonine-protein kinase [Anaerolineae bacterium]|nr:serine/threonine-protein kinase [Anaerolineae bacterium]
MSDTRKFDPNQKEVPDVGLQVDMLLMNRYKIIGVLGGGGMGTVFQARDTHFPEAKRLVAIKEMITPLTNDPAQQQSMLRTFQREANILASLSHAAVPKIYDYFSTEARAYLVMEYINGNDLDALLARTRSLPVQRVVEWAIELCDVLDYLHNIKPQPVIFRDVKPANIMIDSLGKVRLIDFGIAKIFEGDKKHTMIGTEGYSAPEQYRGDVNPRSDIYGLGATLHHVLTRKDPRVEPPFSFHERPVIKFNPAVPQNLIAVIDKALQQRVEDRYATCSEMRQELERVRASGLFSSSADTGMVNPAAMPTPAAPAAPAPAKPKTAPQMQAAPRTDYLDESGSSAVVQARWRFKTEDEIRASPTIFRNVVFVGSYDSNLWAVNAEDGKLVWKLPTGAGIASSPTVDPSTKLVFFGSEDNIIYAADVNSGQVAWTYHTRDKIRASPRVAHNHVFIGSDDGKLYALVAQTGRYLWTFEAGSPIRTRPFVTNELVIFGADDGAIYGIELSGKRKWAIRAKRAVNSSPYVDPKENICFIGSFDGYLYALDASNGYTLWRFRSAAPILSSPVVSDETVYIGATDGKFFAINTSSGKERWQTELPKPIVASPVVHGSFVYIGCTDGAFYCFDTKTGKQVWKFQTNGQITSTPYVENNLLVFGSLDQYLYALPVS